ncbi:FG-GAP repeat domain-containing protein [Streptomyces longispororuber]|uniref:FG-GAP repeat domain-containing protein n=1 Tax=Streptomyces longispororuber TaxID=68230 RepID=UPI00210B346B|nr:VCBS repeat-containing protein [Streptomyces longispororuber]MCQ4208824.1 VCBS repeat-containing protein [Streptomyces longispororuber]
MARTAPRRRGLVPALTCAVVLLAASCTGDAESARPASPGRCSTPSAASPAPAPERTGGDRRRAPNRDDFDGDGRHDLLLTGWNKKRGEAWEPNRSLLLGSSSGAPEGRQVSLTDHFPGIDGPIIGNPGTQGGHVASLTGDLDGDGRADILLTAYRTKRNGDFDHYEEQILWGGAGGVSGQRHQLPDTSVPHLAIGDFDGDGHLDLVSGPYRAAEGATSEVRCAAIEFGPFDHADGSPGRRRFIDITQRGRVYTDSLTAGDFDGDGRDEFVTTGVRAEGRETEDGWPKVFADASYYRVGEDRSVVRAGGIAALGHGKQLPYDPEGDEGGQPILHPADGLAVDRTADFGGNGRVDLIHDDKVVYGGPAGPGTGRATTEPPEGHTSAVGDVNGDGRDDLVTADYRDRQNQVGNVAVFLGGRNGLATTASYTFDRTDVGMPGLPSEDYERDYFGTELALADLDGDGCAELAVETHEFHSLRPARQGVYWIVPGGRQGPVTGRAFRLDAWRIGRD